MARTFQKFLQSKIDLSSVGVEFREDNAPYFCTPKGASIFGWAGVDGIHFCFIRGFGSMVFAISPMNSAPNFVHPLARNFADFLRLLLACGDVAALEQAWMWDEAQFEAFLQDNPPPKEQQKTLSGLAEKMKLKSMEQPWEYIKELQTSFDYSKIKYTEDYYDTDMNLDAEPTIPEWKVYFEGNFWGHSGKERGQVDDGVGIGGDTVIHPQGVVLGEDIPHRDLQISRETILSIGAFGLQKQGIAKGLYLIQLAREGAVQVVFAVVGFQLVGLAAHIEHGILDAVGVPAHERAAAGTAGRFKVLDVIGVGVVAQHHIHRPALGGYPDILDDTAVVQHTDRQPAGVRDDVFIDLFAVWGHAKGLGEKLCHRARLLLYFLGTAHSLFYPLLF